MGVERLVGNKYIYNPGQVNRGAITRKRLQPSRANLLPGAGAPNLRVLYNLEMRQ